MLKKVSWPMFTLSLLVVFVLIFDCFDVNVKLGNHFNPTLLSGVFAGIITLCAMWFIDEKQAKRIENKEFIEQYSEKLFAFKKALQDFTYIGCRNHSKLPKIITDDFDKISFNDLSKTVIAVNEECKDLSNYCIFFAKEAAIKNKEEFNQIDTLISNFLLLLMPISAVIAGSITPDKAKNILKENFMKAILDYMPEKDLKEKFSLYKEEFNENNISLIHQIIIDDIREKALNINNIIGYKKI